MRLSRVASVVVFVLVEAPILMVSARCARREEKERQGEDEGIAMARRRRHRMEDTKNTPQL